MFFAIGVGIAYVVLPYAVQFLLQFSSEYLNPLITAGPYFDFVTTLFLAFGLIMEFPILLFGLSRVGIVTSKRLASSRRVALLVIAVFAAAATPGGDSSARSSWAGRCTCCSRARSSPSDEAASRSRDGRRRGRFEDRLVASR